MGEAFLDVSDDRARESLLPAHHEQWGEGLPIEAYRACLDERLGHEWARRRVRNLIVREENGEVLSSLRLYGVRALRGGLQVWLGGIAEVLTPRQFRGKGHASRLLRLTMELLEREGVDGAYLFSDIDPAFYERFGFKLAGSSRVESPLDRLPHEETRGIVRPLAAADWEAVRGIHRRAGEGEALWFLRDDSQWDYLLGRWPRWAHFDPRYRIVSLDCVAVREGRIAAYAIALAEVAERTLRLLEFGLESREAETLDLLLSDMRRRAEALGCDRFEAPWPPGSWARLLMERFEPVPRRDGILMLASLSPRFGLEGLAGLESGYWETDHV